MSDSPAVRFRVSKPPSINAAFNNASGVGRRKTPAYKAWRKAALWEMKLAGIPVRAGPVPGLVPGDVVVLYRCGPRNKAADVCNLEKPMSDLLSAPRVIDDDRFIVRCTIEWAEDVDGVETSIWKKEV